MHCNSWRWTAALALTTAIATVAGASTLGARAATEPFVYAEAFPFSTMDPAAAGLNPDMLVTQNTYDALTRYDESAPAKVLPALATSWKRAGKVWTFKLRKGVKFTDGQTFGAADVKASIDRMIKLGQGLSYVLYDVERVRVVNKSTVRIIAKTKSQWLPANLTKVGIASASDIRNHAVGDDLAAAWLKDHNNGTGPYRVDAFTPGQQLVLKRNTRWWGKFSAHPIDTFIDKFVIDGTQRFIGLKGGQYQLAAFISADNALSLDRSRFHRVFGHNLWGRPLIAFSTTTAPLNNAKLRAAMVAAFDYKAMVKYYHYASTSNGPIPGWVPGSPNKDLPKIKQDLAKAKSLVAASGLKDPTFTCAVPNSSPDYGFAAQVLQAEAAKIGVTIKLQSVQVTQVPELMKSGQAPCTVYGEASNSPDPIPFFRARYIPEAFVNLYNWKSTRLLKLMNKYPNETNPKKQYQILKQMCLIIANTHMDLWTVSPVTIMPMPNSVTGYKIDPFNLINVRISALNYQP
jgi:ABC-type transport system substrate-binding protein